LDQQPRALTALAGPEKKNCGFAQKRRANRSAHGAASINSASIMRGIKNVALLPAKSSAE
jgi:hypothetical protein